jgi:hypothetical protein
MATKGPAAPLLDEIHLFGELLNVAGDLGLTQKQVDAIQDIEHCGDGKLFNVELDPTEQQDLSADTQYADILQSLRADLAAFNKGKFDPDRGKPTMESCRAAMAAGGYYGPDACYGLDAEPHVTCEMYSELCFLAKTEDDELLGNIFSCLKTESKNNEEAQLIITDLMIKMAQASDGISADESSKIKEIKEKLEY